MITVHEALEIILNEIKPLETETVGILDSIGRVIAEDVTARWGNPPWDNSAMDGYALRSGDVAGASKTSPVTLSVIYDLPAGQLPKGRVGAGEAVRIMTGAPAPDGADAVVMVEQTKGVEPGKVQIFSTPKPGENIRRSGEDFKKDETVIKKGSLIRPAEISMLATVGRPSVSVYKRPVVSVLSTGDELVDISSAPEKGKITNSNGYALSALVAEAGAEFIQLGIAKDTKEDLSKKLKEAVKADAIITSGGVSVGDYDFVKDVLKGLGSSMKFWKVALKPGKPLAFGMIQGRPAFGLPGNPISSMVAFEQFVRPSLLKMAGRTDIFRLSLTASLSKDVSVKPGRMTFLRAELKAAGAGFEATPLDGQGSGVISTMVKANAYIIVPAECEGLKKGEPVKCQPFDATILSAQKPSY